MDFTFGDWQLKFFFYITKSSIHSTPPVTIVLLRHIINSHSENCLVCVIGDWKLSWILWPVCSDFNGAEQPRHSATQVFFMVCIVRLIETWNRDGASNLDWHFTYVSTATLNSWQNNSRQLIHSVAFKLYIYILCVYISLIHQLQVNRSHKYTTHLLHNWICETLLIINIDGSLLHQDYQYSVNYKPHYHLCIVFLIRLKLTYPQVQRVLHEE